jgi:hypothetical protein
MPRRLTTNSTQIPRIANSHANDAWASYVCIKCHQVNFENAGETILTEQEAYENANWICASCGFVHSSKSGLPSHDIEGNQLPFSNWADGQGLPGDLYVERFWLGFFRSSVANKEDYWKICNVCGRTLPNSHFARHVGWGPLEKQMECKSCKAAINAVLNPLRTSQQLHEAGARRRAADLLLDGVNESVNIDELFIRFGAKCFKTGEPLDKNDRASWAIDHILPSRWLYPLTTSNAALLSSRANGAKSDKWPSDFYNNEELIRLAQITGADLGLISNSTPILNQKVDVNACVDRLLTVRSGTDLTRRVGEIRKLLEDYDLLSQLSEDNKRLLGVI